MALAIAIACARASTHGTTARGSARRLSRMRKSADRVPRQKLREERRMKTEWPLWEIFIRSQHGLAHKHVGSLHAADAEMAIKNARDVYTRRNEGVSIWVVPSSEIHASSPDASG